MKKRKNAGIRVIALLICVSLFCVSSYMVFSQLFVDYKQNQTFGLLVEQVNQARNNADMLAQNREGSVETGDIQGEGVHKPEQIADEVGAPDAPSRMPMLSAYAPIYEQNEDFFGWIEIEETEVNYPVMYTPEDPEFYLHRAFDRSEAYSGVPFLAADCFAGCGNLIVYGHNMKNGTQFATIPKYKDKAFWEAHPTVRFDTLYETGIYDIVAAFYSQAYPDDAMGVFRYYQYTDIREEDAFTEYVRQVKAAALYETGVEPQYGDQLLTLSTCEYHKTDGRFVVVARKR